jgi:hypothetical protein
MYRGVLQSSGSVVVISLSSFKALKILDPSILEIGPSGFAKLGSAEQIFALCIG